MPSFTLRSRFPTGTNVNAYEARGADAWQGPPVEGIAETQTMGANGATFTTLQRKRYFFHAVVGGADVVVIGTPGEDRNPYAPAVALRKGAGVR